MIPNHGIAKSSVLNSLYSNLEPQMLPAITQECEAVVDRVVCNRKGRCIRLDNLRHLDSGTSRLPVN